MWSPCWLNKKQLGQCGPKVASLKPLQCSLTSSWSSLCPALATGNCPSFPKSGALSLHFSFLSISVSSTPGYLAPCSSFLLWKAHFKSSSFPGVFSDLPAGGNIDACTFPLGSVAPYLPSVWAASTAHWASQLFWSKTHLFTQNFFSSLRQTMQQYENRENNHFYPTAGTTFIILMYSFLIFVHVFWICSNTCNAISDFFFTLIRSKTPFPHVASIVSITIFMVMYCSTGY